MMKNNIEGNIIRVTAASPLVRPADIGFNTAEMCKSIDKAVGLNSDLILFPELSITGYTCGDLFNNTLLWKKSEEALGHIALAYKDAQITIVVGLPLQIDSSLYNCAAVISGGKVRGIVPKTHIPNYGEYYEKRWFKSGKHLRGDIIINGESCPIGTDLLFNINNVKTGIEICEDLWVPIPPSSRMALNGATLILNLSATNELIGKYDYLCDLIKNQSARCRCAYVYASAGTGESSTDLAFAGNCIVAENGRIIEKSPRFTVEAKEVTADIDIDLLIHDRVHFNTFGAEDDNPETRTIDIRTSNGFANWEKGYFLKPEAHPFIDKNRERMIERCEEISSIQAWGLAMRLRAINCDKAIIGVSGGLDSTLALLVTIKAFEMLGLDKKGIVAVTMPGFGTSDRTFTNSEKLIDRLGVSKMVVPIGKTTSLHLLDIGHDTKKHDVTYENSQARMRTMILMDIANKENGIVIGTGDLSELALGWCTYNGDQMSMYGVNASIPKTLIKYLVEGYALQSNDEKLSDLLHAIIDTPISPELLPTDDGRQIKQKTEDLVGPYELHDFFIYHFLRHGEDARKIERLAIKAFENKYDEATIKKWLKTFVNRFFSQQFKRSAMPDGIKAGSVSLSPRGDWRMPSDASPDSFLEDI